MNAPPSTRLHRLGATAAFALITFLLAGIGRLLSLTDGMAPMWLANVAVLAPLLRFPMIDRRFAIAGATIGFGIVYALTASSPSVALPQLIANLAEIAAALLLVERLRSVAVPLYAPRNLIVFFAAAGTIAPALAALIGAGALALLESADFVEVARRWFAADALGMIVFGPLILAAGRSDCSDMLRSRRRWEVLPVALLAGAVTLLVFGAARYPALFLILPTIIVAIFRLRFIGAAASILTVTAVATIETAWGIGPIANTFAQTDQRLLFLQIFLAVLVASTMPMAAILVDREQTLRRLAERERQYRLLADHSNDMIVRIGLDGVRRFVSPASRTILGYDPEEMIGITPIAAIHPEDRARVEKVCRSLLDGAIDPVCSYRQRRRDGAYIWLEATYRLVRDDKDQPAEFIASVRDVARRHTAERETASAMARLQENYRLLSMAETLAGIGHWRLDAINQDLFWSDEVYRIHGRSVGDLPALADAIRAYHPEDRIAVQRDVDKALRQGRPWMFRARIVRPDGTIRHVESSGQAERAPDGTIVGIVGIFRDVTDEVDAAAALIAARDAARASADARSAFLATMSHEIRTPMTGVLGMIELLDGKLADEERARFFANLKQSATLLMTILDDVLDFSKIESGNLTIEQVDFDLENLCRNTVDLFSHAACGKGLALSFTTANDHPAHLLGDPTRIQQVLSNLINNAIKFTPHGGVELRLTVTPDGERHAVRIDVVDTGIGMDGATLDRIFDPFIQADASTTRQFGGTGLGLAIARRLVDAMGGRIDVDSQAGVGTRFIVQLTLEAGRGPSLAPAVVTGSRSARPLSILLAEDNPINRTLVEALVRRGGHRVCTVENGQLAVVAAQRERFDVILMDMQMPGMDGLTATCAIREGPGPCADVPIIALTADATPARRARYVEAGLTGFLAKPIDTELFLDTLRSIAEGQYAPAPTSPTHPLVDRRRLDVIEQAVGRDNAARIFAMVRTELTTRPRIIATLIAQKQHVAVMSETHSLRGAVMGAGCVHVGQIAASIEKACQAGRPVDKLAANLVAAADATCREFDRLGR